MEALTRFDLGMDGYMEPTENGEYCYASDAEKLQAEIAALKSPPKVLSAQEVAEPGWYWHIERGWGEWHIHRIVRFGVLDDLHTMESDYSYRELHGQFIGPIQMPEV